MASSFYNNSVLLTKFVGWLVLELLFYILGQPWLFNLPTIPLDFWSIKTGENTFIFDSDRCITWLFLPQSEELAESWFDWTDGKTSYGCLVKTSVLSPWNDLKDFNGV